MCVYPARFFIIKSWVNVKSTGWINELIIFKNTIFLFWWWIKCNLIEYLGTRFEIKQISSPFFFFMVIIEVENWLEHERCHHDVVVYAAFSRIQQWPSSDSILMRRCMAMIMVPCSSIDSFFSPGFSMLGPLRTSKVACKYFMLNLGSICF